MQYLPEPDVTQTVDDEGRLVLLAARTGAVYQGNSTAARLWQALIANDGHAALAAKSVAGDLAIEEAEVRSDLEELLGQLTGARLMQRIA